MACNGAAAIRVWEGMAAQVRQVDTHCPTQPWNHTTILHFRNPLPACPQGRKKNASASGVTVAGVASAAAAAQLAEKAKKDHTHADFYRFQQREKRRNGGWLAGAEERAEMAGGGASRDGKGLRREATGMTYQLSLHGPHGCPYLIHLLTCCTHLAHAELLDLRERFEADKRRLADLRTARKWKPY